MDMPEFERVEDEDEDYNLEDFFLNPTLYPLQPMIDYRIKLLLKNDTLLLAGETQVVNTSCLMKGKLKTSMSKLSMFLTPYENLPLSFESGGYISRKYRGRIVIKLTNYSTNSTKLHSGTTVGYIVMQPFSME